MQTKEVLMGQFDHLFIAPSDWDKAFEFYNEILGWEVGASWGEKGKEPRGAYLKSSEGMTVVIAEEHQTDDNSWTQGFNGHRPTIHLNVEDVDDVFKKFRPAHISFQLRKILIGALVGFWLKILMVISSHLTPQRSKRANTVSI